MVDLSILIPSRQEKWLQKTIEDIELHKEGSTEVLWEEDLGLGQRALTNKLAKQATGKYLMKVDAHCSFSQGFDVKMMAEMDDKTILSPMLLPLYPDNWEINGKKQMLQFNFGKDFVMQHVEGDEGETMCLQGSAWMIERENYWKWNVCDESLGSWGMQGIELGIKAYLNGGRCKTTRSAYYGHVFRHDAVDFPYSRGTDPGKHAHDEMVKRYCNDSIKGLIEKFNYPVDWTPELVKNLPKIT